MYGGMCLKSKHLKSREGEAEAQGYHNRVAKISLGYIRLAHPHLPN